MRQEGSHFPSSTAEETWPKSLKNMGELSSARQVVEGADLAKGDQRTRALLIDVNRRPNHPRNPLPEEVTAFEPARFELDGNMLARNLRTSRRGAAGGPSGMTTEHFRPLLDDTRGMRLFTELGSRLAKALVPQVAIDLIRVGRLTALSKLDGGVRGIVAGDVVRRLVVRTMAQQLSEAVERATAPYQYALSTRAGCECVAHVLQGITELHPELTITSIDGISAFDMISRESMMRGLLEVEGGGAALPFVRMFYGSPSEYLWEDDGGTVHRIPQGEGASRATP